MLYARGDMVFANMVGVIALIAFDGSLDHACIDDGVLAIALPDTRPARVATQIDGGIVDPRAVGRAGLVGIDGRSHLGQLRIERGCDVDGLWKKRATLYIGGAVVIVKTIDTGNADMLHRLFLDGLDNALPLVDGLGARGRSVEDRANLVFLKYGVEGVLVDFPYHLGVAGIDVEIVFLQLLDHIGIVHAHESGDLLVFETGFQQFVAHLAAVKFGVDNLHLAKAVDV